MIFLFSIASRLIVGLTQPPIQWIQGLFFPGIKQLGHEGDQSPPCSAEVKNAWSIDLLPIVSLWYGASVSTGTVLGFYLLFIIQCIFNATEGKIIYV